MSFLGVAQEAGLTTRPIYDRFKDTSDIGVDLWRSQIGPELGRRLDAVFASVFTSGDVGQVVEALEPFIRPGDALTVAAELIAAAPYDEPLQAAIRDTALVGAILQCRPSAERTPEQAAQGAYVLVVALGLLMIRSRPEAATVDVSADVNELLKALAHPGPVSELPAVSAPHMRDFVAEDPDPKVAAILTATLRAVAERGYTGATTEYIAERADVSQGALFSRYDSKLQLFIAATGRQQRAAFRANYALQRELTAKIGPGLAEAVLMREWMRPEHQPGRALVLEQLRLSWHDEIMQAVVEDLEREFMAEIASEQPAAHQHRIDDYLHWALALGQGCTVMGTLVPWAWQLPMSVVTVPLLD